MYFDPELVVPDDRLSLRDGAIAPWANSTSQYYRQTLQALAAHFDFALTTPFRELPEKVRQMLLFGSGKEAVSFRYDDGVRDYQVTQAVRGRHPEHGAALAGDRIGLGARGAVALSDRHPLRDLRRQAAEAGGAGGQGRRARHQRGDRDVDRRGGRLVRRAGRAARRRSSARSPGASCARSTSGWASSTTSASTT